MKMRVLCVNGSPHEHGCTDAALQALRETLTGHGIVCETLWLGRAPVADCIGCGSCAKTGKCIFDDEVNAIASRLDYFDGIVCGSPVYYAGPSGRLTSFLDRLFYSAGGRMKGKPAAAVVSCRRGGASAAFDRINKYFQMSNMIVVGSQYWNQVHGARPDEVERDEEGLQTMRTLGENMAWLLRCIEAGRTAGVDAPIYEKKIRTNFIR